MTKALITITGPSASGKSTLESLLVKNPKYGRIVSTTTRPPRPGEVESGAYYFMSEEEFKATPMIENVEFNGALYGVSVSEIERVNKEGRIAVIVVEPEGRKQIFRWAIKEQVDAVCIFIDTPTSVRIKRLADRFMNECLLSFGGFSEARLNQFCSRLTHSVEVESTWREHINRYDYVIDRFEKDNTAEVMADLELFLGMTIREKADFA